MRKIYSVLRNHVDIQPNKNGYTLQWENKIENFMTEMVSHSINNSMNSRVSYSFLVYFSLALFTFDPHWLGHNESIRFIWCQNGKCNSNSLVSTVYHSYVACILWGPTFQFYLWIFLFIWTTVKKQAGMTCKLTTEWRNSTQLSRYWWYFSSNYYF